MEGFSQFLSFFNSNEAIPVTEIPKAELSLGDDEEAVTPRQATINLLPNSKENTDDSNSNNPSTFKVPFPIIKVSESAVSDADIFPMIDGPQRVSTGKKVPLGKGFSSIDWRKLSESDEDLRGVPQIKRYTVTELSKFNKKEELYLAFKGKVYNCTAYLPFHPGGKGKLMRGAGKDASELINKVHPWVNIDKLLEKCFVGYLVSD